MKGIMKRFGPNPKTKKPPTGQGAAPRKQEVKLGKKKAKK